MSAQFAVPKARRYALIGARVLDANLRATGAPVDFDGFAPADILIDKVG